MRDLSREGAPFLKLFDDFSSRWAWVDNDGTRAFLRTDRDAPRGRLVSVDLAAPAPVLVDVIPQGDAVLQSVHAVGGRFVVVTMRDASVRARIHGRDGKPGKEIALPALGTVTGFSGRPTDGDTYFSFSSFTYPSTVYRLDLASATATVFQKPRVDFDPAAFETKQVFYPSKDGTSVPMFVVAKKGMKRDGKNPTILYGYGGFNVNQSAVLLREYLAFVESGGVSRRRACAAAGSTARTGTRPACSRRSRTSSTTSSPRAECAHRRTRSRRRSSSRSSGGSNGGLLVGAAVTSVPSCSARRSRRAAHGHAPLPPVHDRLGLGGRVRLRREGRATSSSSTRTRRSTTSARASRYPAMLFTTADDDRVVPGARVQVRGALQEAQAGDAPILIRIETKAGHGAGKPTTKLIDEATDQLAFLAKTLGSRGTMRRLLAAAAAAVFAAGLWSCASAPPPRRLPRRRPSPRPSQRLEAPAAEMAWIVTAKTANVRDVASTKAAPSRS